MGRCVFPDTFISTDRSLRDGLRPNLPDLDVCSPVSTLLLGPEKKTPTAWVVWMGAKKTRKVVLVSKKKTFSIEREAAESKLAEGVGLSKAVIRAIPLHHLPSIQRYLEESVGLVGCSWRC